MPLIQRQCIEEIRQRVSLVDVAGTYVQLKRAGSQFRGLSPFSQEKSPSFFIHPEKNVFKCYSSGNAGDLFRFVQLKENLTFNEAVESLAKQYSISLTYEEGSDTGESMSLRKELLSIHELATDYFHKAFLADTPQAGSLRDYWQEERGFTLELAEEYKVGFAPTGGRNLLDGLQKKSFTEEALMQCGLFYANNRGPQSFKARFRGRLMIPIRDVQGRVVAFTARLLKDLTPKDDPTKEAKYVNSPETPIFSKSNLLFGLEVARKHVNEETPLLLVEGQLDALRCHSHGFLTAIAPQGTSVTEQQLVLMRRYTTRIDCILDGDSAGQKAAMRLLPMALKAGLSLKFISLAPGQDPDTLLKEGGKEALDALSNKALDAMEFAVKSLAPKGMSASADEKERAFRTLFDFFQGSESLASAEINLKKVGNLLGMYEYTVDKALSHLRIGGNENNTKPINQEGVTQLPSSKLTTAEYQLLLVLLTHEELAATIAQYTNPEWIDTDCPHGSLLNRFIAEIREDLWHGTESIDELLETEKEHNIVYSILAEGCPFKDPKRAIKQCLEALHATFVENRKKELSRKLSQTKSDDFDTLKQLQLERIALRNELKHPPQFF